MMSTTKVTAFDVRKDDLLLLEESDLGLYRVESATFSRRAQGAANMQLALRHLLRGNKKEIRVGSTEFMERAELDQTRTVQTLYTSGTDIVVMDENFEQFEIASSMLGDSFAYLQDGMQLKVESWNGKPVIATMPEKAVFELIEVSAPEQKEDKGAREVSGILSNGVKIKVPKHIKQGDKIAVYTATGLYAGKA